MAQTKSSCNPLPSRRLSTIGFAACGMLSAALIGCGTSGPAYDWDSVTGGRSYATSAASVDQNLAPHGFPKVVAKAEAVKDAEPVVLRLSLAACFDLMKAHNRELVLEGIKRELARANTVRAGGFTDVVLGAQLSYERAQRPLDSRLTGDTRTESIETTLAGDIDASVPFYTGTTLTFAHSFRKVTTNSPFSTFEWDSELSATLRQNLLDGFGVATNRADLDIANKELLATEGEITQATAGVRYGVAEAYWNLVLAREELAVLERQQESARIAVETAVRREREGLDSGLDVLRARSTLATRSRDIISQQLEVSRASDRLVRAVHPDLLSGYALIAGYKLVVETRDSLSGEIPDVTVPKAHDEVITGLANRRDLLGAIRRLEAAGIRVRQRENAQLPSLDVELSARLTGLGDDYGRTLDGISGMDGRTLRGAFIFEMPIGDSVARANESSAKAEMERSIIQLRDLETTVMLDVVDAIREIEASIQSVRVAVEARDLARQEYQATVFRRSIDRGTSFEIKEAEAELTARERDLLKARVDLELARLRLARATGVVD